MKLTSPSSPLPSWRAAVLFIAAIGDLSLAGAADWPQFRGPQRNGISTEKGLLKQWPEGGPKLQWTAKGLGSGYSGVSVAGGRIYTMGDGDDASYLHALDEATGKIVWSVKVGATGGDGGNKYPGTRCTPTVEGSTVYTLGQWGDLVAVEAATGKEIWRKNLMKDLGGKMMSQWNYSESPLVDGNNLICCPGGADGTMVALNKKTGALVWRTKGWTDKASYSSVVVATIGGVRQYVQLTDAHVVGVQTTDGKVLWQAPRAGKVAVIPNPIVDGNLVYVASGYGIGCNLFRVDSAGGKFTAEQVYASKDMVNHHGGVVKVGDNVFGFSDGNGWVWQDLKTGQTTFKADQRKFLGKGSVTVADGMLYLRAEGKTGTIVLLDGTVAEWKEKGRFEQPERSDKSSWPHPVIANGRLYIRDQQVLLAYDVKQR